MHPLHPPLPPPAPDKAGDLAGALDSHTQALALAGTNYQAAVSAWATLVDEVRDWVGTAREHDVEAMVPVPSPLAGRRVVVYGTSRADLNETTGECVRLSEATGRYLVALDATGQTMKIKPFNLREEGAWGGRVRRGWVVAS